MEQYIPDIYQKSIYTIPYSKLYLKGIHVLLYDLDNTISPVFLKEPSLKVKELFDDLKQQGFTLYIFSNGSKKRVNHFCDILEVDGSYRACKPAMKHFRSFMLQHKIKENEVAMIGDQLLTDILGGNRVGITTILVNPISNKDLPPTYINRIRERKIIKKLRNRNLFAQGRYYE